MKHRYKSSIPIQATERITQRHDNNNKAEAEYILSNDVVGKRLFYEDGTIEFDYAIRDGEPHGYAYRFYESGKMMQAVPYRSGQEHGTIKQWSEDGDLLGTYDMDKGTGVDLWWQEDDDGLPFLAEVRYTEDGQTHGPEWWLYEDQEHVYIERHWKEGQLHGIEREWQEDDDELIDLLDGYPKYWVEGEEVTKTAYNSARRKDKSLPSYRKKDDKAYRQFPDEIQTLIERQGMFDFD